MIIFAWRCIIINKTRRNPFLFLSNKTVFTKLSRKNANFKRFFGDCCDFFGPYITPPPVAGRTVYMVIFAWRCIIINKTRRNPVLFLSNKTVFTTLLEKTPILNLFWRFFVIFGSLYYLPHGS